MCLLIIQYEYWIFNHIYALTKLRETDQINNAQISSFYSGVTQFVSTVAKKKKKKKLKKSQCLSVWSEIQ